MSEPLPQQKRVVLVYLNIATVAHGVALTELWDCEYIADLSAQAGHEEEWEK